MNKRTSLIFTALAMGVTILGVVIHQPWLYVVAFWSALLFAFLFLRRGIKESAANERIALSEAGKALTDTLKIAFDSLKKLNGEKNKQQGKLNELTRRLGVLEQQVAVIARHKKEVVATPQSNPILRRPENKNEMKSLSSTANKILSPPAVIKYTEATNMDKNE